jgi:hypothetical protein
MTLEATRYHEHAIAPARAHGHVRHRTDASDRDRVCFFLCLLHSNSLLLRDDLIERRSEDVIVLSPENSASFMAEQPVGITLIV